MRYFPEVRCWCYTEVSTEDWAITYIPKQSSATYTVGFKNAEDATYFKIVFSNISVVSRAGKSTF